MAVLKIRTVSQPTELEKFFDVYEVNTSDVDNLLEDYVPNEIDDQESLKVLKTLLYRVRSIRKVLLCCLLAVDAEGTSVDLERWNAVVPTLETIGIMMGAAADRIREIFDEEEVVPGPPSPTKPSPNFERRKTQMRKLNSLTQSLRGLQAKMYALREETDKSLEKTDEISDYGSDLMTQYDAIGSDLKLIMQEWESGKVALAMNIDKTEKRLSQTSLDLKSPTFSWGGSTLSGDSPSDALRALIGELPRNLDIMEVDEEAEDQEKVYEAVALPRARSMLSREERIQKMKESREQAQAAKNTGDENTKMLKELRTVINLRPRGRTASRASMPA